MKIENKLTYLEMFIGVVLFLLLFVAIPGVAGNIQTHYTRKDCVVVSITDEGVVAKDKGDRLWSFYITEDSELKVNDTVDLKMFNNYTDNDITDDEVVGVK